MPVEQGYQTQVAPSGPVPLPDASPASFGAGVGGAIAGIGDAAHEADLRAYHIQREQQTDAQAADFNAKFSAARLAADKASVDARNNAAPGGAGHADAMGQYWQAQSQDLLSGITDDKLRRSVGQQLDEFGTRFQSAEYQWQEGARIGKVVTDTQQATSYAANRAFTAHDQQSFSEELSLGRQAIEAMPNVPPDVKDKLAKQHDQTVTESFARGVIKNNPAGAKNVLDSGTFDAILEPQQLETLRRQADTAQRRQDAVAQHQAGLAKQAAVQNFETLKAQSAAGIQISDDDLSKAEMALAGTGAKDAQQVQLHALRVQSQVNNYTQPWLPQQFSTEIDRLSALGKARTADQDITLQQLQTIAPTRTRQLQADPGTWAASNGLPPPAVDPRNPATVAARQQWAATVQKQTGVDPGFLGKDEVATYQQQLAAGAPGAGRMQVINELAQLGPQAGVQAMRQVAPNDAMAARMIALPPAYRMTVADGASARKANPALIDGNKPGTPGASSAADFAKAVGPALSLLTPDDQHAVLEMSRSMYASYMFHNAGSTYSQAGFSNMIHEALGGTRDGQGSYRGGLGNWQGTPVLLPDGVSAGQFDQHLAALNWGSTWKGAPAFRDGSPMSATQVRQYVPTIQPDGRYQFRGPNNALLHKKDGTVFSLRMDQSGFHP